MRHHTVIRNFFLKTSRRFFFQKSWPRGPIAPIRLPSIVPYSGARTSKLAQTILPERCRSKMVRAISTHDLRTLKRRFRHVAARCARRGAARTRTFMRGVRAIPIRSGNRPCFSILCKNGAAARPRRAADLRIRVRMRAPRMR